MRSSHKQSITNYGDIELEKALDAITTMNIVAPLVALLRKHLLAVFFAFFCGAFIVAPQIIFITHEGEHYKGLYMMKTEAEWYYLARIHEFYDEGRIGNPFLFEHKHYGPQFLQSGGEMILAIPGILLNISVSTLSLIYKFVLPAITFLLLYMLIFRLTASSAWSIAGGLFFLIGSTWLYANNLSHLLRGDAAFFTEFIYNRPVHPQFDGVLFFLYLNVLLSAFRSQNVRWIIFLGVLLGLSFYTYFYSFTFFLALNFVVIFLWFFSGRKVQARNLTFATIGGFLFGIPQILLIYAALHHPDYPLVAAIQPLTYGHLPEISKNGLIVSLFFVIHIFYTKAYQAVGFVREHCIFLIGLLLTTFIVVNQQVLTGISLHSGHYHHNFNIPIFIILFMFLASSISQYQIFSRPNLRMISTVLPWLLSVVFIVTGVFIQYFSYVQGAPQARADQRYMSAFLWLNEHSPKESVVMANQAISDIIPVFTMNNVMWDRGAPTYLVPAERARFTPENLLKSTDFLRDIKQYRVDYILWDWSSDPDWNIDRLQLPILFSSEGLIIYELPK